MAGIYDLTLANAASDRIPALGTYVKVLSAPYGAVQIKLDGGESFQLLEGQGFRLEPGAEPFRDVFVKNVSGTAQTVLIFIGTRYFEDTRITGVVSIVDGGRARTLLNIAHLGSTSITTGAGQLPALQYYNPAASGKRVVLEAVQITVSAAMAMRFGRLNEANVIAGPDIDVRSKLIAASAAMAPKMRRDVPAAIPGAFSSIFAVTLAVAQTFTYVFKEPVILAPGEGVAWMGDVVAGMTASMLHEGYEEAI